jgi:hypothetical protein
VRTNATHHHATVTGLGASQPSARLHHSANCSWRPLLAASRTPLTAVHSPRCTCAAQAHPLGRLGWLGWLGLLGSLGWLGSLGSLGWLGWLGWHQPPLPLTHMQALHTSAPTSLPELHFLGADRLLAPLRHALNSNLSRWQPQRSVRLNLQEVLQLTFPSPQQGSMGGAEDYAVECAICYNYRLEDQSVPECACDGCGKPYHGACLSEWLRALPTTQQSFNRLFGDRRRQAATRRHSTATQLLLSCQSPPLSHVSR